MPYPSMIDYNEVVQHPQSAFTDPELQKGKLATNPLGLPLALSGGFALTYQVSTPSGRSFAVRCFHREIPGIAGRYLKISSRLQQLKSPYFVHFDFQNEGIRVRGKAYPIVKMDWVTGDTLRSFFEKNAGQPQPIRQVQSAFRQLAKWLEGTSIAHGDIQNDNVIVDGGNIRLIDYDGMYVSDLAVGKGTEIGHRHFQHPRRSTSSFGPYMDRFSFIVLDVSLSAISNDQGLWQRFSEGGEGIVFCAADLADPDRSDIFQILQSRSDLNSSVCWLASLCKGQLDAVPSLADFVAGHLPAITSSALQAPRQILGYTGPYLVVDAQNYAACEAQVGNRVELVGKIVDVFEGKTGRGRRPYVFVNFGDWHVSTARLTIWSETLAAFKDPPSRGWQGQWVSVVGLIEAPYEGRKGGRGYRSTGITIADPGQIHFIDEQEALFRLGRGAKTELRRRVQAGVTGRRSGLNQSPGSGRTDTKSLTEKREGEDVYQTILGGLAAGSGPGGPSPPVPLQATSSSGGAAKQTLSDQRKLKRVGKVVMLVGAAVLIFWLLL